MSLSVPYSTRTLPDRNRRVSFRLSLDSISLVRSLILVSVLGLTACDSGEPVSVVGQWVGGGRPITFDVPFAGTACDREYTAAQRETRGWVDFFDLTITEDAEGLSGQSYARYETRAVVRQPGLPDCLLGGDSSSGYNDVEVTLEGDRLTTGRVLFAARGEFRVEASALVGTLSVAPPGSYEYVYVFGAPHEVAITLSRRVGAP